MNYKAVQEQRDQLQIDLEQLKQETDIDALQKKDETIAGLNKKLKAAIDKVALNAPADGDTESLDSNPREGGNSSVAVAAVAKYKPDSALAKDYVTRREWDIMKVSSTL